MKIKNSYIFRHVSIRIFLLALVLLAMILSGGACSKDNNTIALKAKITSPGIDIEIYEGETVFFKGLATNGSPPYKFLWHFGSDLPDASGQYVQETVFNFEGSYTVTLTVTDSNGDKDIDTASIVVIPKDTLRPGT